MLFTKPEHKLAAAIAGIEKFVKQFDAAADAAAKEMSKVDSDCESKVASCEKALIDAKEVYEKAQVTHKEKADAAISAAEERKQVLSKVLLQASAVSENIRKQYGLTA